MTAEAVIAEAVERFHPRVALACSFQKEETVLLDLLLKAEPGARVFALDTRVLFDETYEYWQAVEERYGTKVEVFEADDPPDRLWETDPAACCGIRKVAPLKQALSGLDAWITGMRREQSPTRSDIEEIGWDAKHGLWKFNPLAGWTERDVWAYIADHGLPSHPLHDRGFASIGCVPCTQPGSGREGRWAGSEKTECGLHV
jgi:phosphoadenosine phosphosulfate reductase